MDIKLGIIINNRRVAKFTLKAGAEVILGKDVAQSNGVQINHPNISKQHAQLMLDSNNNLYLIDLNSTNGTFINDKLISSNVPYSITSKE